MTTYQQIKNETINKSYDIDGYYGAQCWDFACYVFEHYFNGTRIYCGVTGYVQDFVTQKNTNGILNFMNEVSLNSELQSGDVCVWGPCATAPYSHVALYDSSNGSNQAYFLGQNQNGANYVTVSQLSTSGIIGVFRAKNMSNGGSHNPNPTTPDQILTVGSKVQFPQNLKVENIDIPNNLIYNSRIGGWVSASICTETSTADGACDQILNIGSDFTIPGTFTVTQINIPSDIVYLQELGFWVKSEPLTEVADGN
ncbi:hypothetical protein ACTNED_10045 [Absicoccus porci]|uniref:hypothetical protein n=1 Tax=Absicoccus porci TaxID=2486576 RepID=UPI003F8C9FFE